MSNTLSISITTTGTTVIVTDLSTYDDTYSRSISIIDENGNFVDCGATKNKYTIALDRAYYKTGANNGASITLPGCDVSVGYIIPVVYNDASFEAMLNDMASSLNASYLAYQTNPNPNRRREANVTVVANTTNDTVTIETNEPGLPQYIYTASIPSNTTFTQTNAANQNLVPANVSGDNVTFTMPLSGIFTARLNVFTNVNPTDICDEVEKTEETFTSFNASILTLQDCFLSLMSGSCGCGCNACASKKATEVRNKLEAVTLLQQIPGSDTKIEDTLNSALADCESINCGCNG